MTCEFSLQRTAWTVKKHYPTGISALITLEARGAKTCSNCADVVQRLSQFTYSLLKPSISSCPEGQSLINPEYHCFISILLTSGRRMVVCMWQVGADERARHGDLRRGVIQVFYRLDNLDFCVRECVYACVCVCWGGIGGMRRWFMRMLRTFSELLQLINSHRCQLAANIKRGRCRQVSDFSGTHLDS